MIVLRKVYSAPMVLSTSVFQFETAQSWNLGHGNLNHWGTGNDGIYYPNDPYTGERTPGNTNANGGVVNR